MSKTKLIIKDNGCIRIEGDYEITDMEGNKYNIPENSSTALCRCGLSKNKPFCDGEHKGKFEHKADAIAFNSRKEA